MQRLHSVGVLSFAKFMAITSALVALIFSVIYGLIIIAMGAGAMGGADDAALVFGGGLLGGLAVMVIGPILYLVLGFIFGLIYAVFLNLALKLIGGLEMDIS